MPAHHLAALKHLEHHISIAGLDLLTALPRKEPLFICQVSTVLIAEEQGHPVFVDRLLVRKYVLGAGMLLPSGPQ